MSLIETPHSEMPIDSDIDELVEAALLDAGRPVDLHDLRKTVGTSAPELHRALRRLERAGKARRWGSSWKSTDAVRQPDAPASGREKRVEARCGAPEGWDAVRALCRYYHECLELEAGGSASLEVGDQQADAVELQQAPDWGRLASGGSVRLPADDALFRLFAASDKHRLRLAGPLDIVSGRRKSEAQVVPIFLMTVVATRRAREIEIRAESEPKVNEAWIKSRLAGLKAERRDELLIRLGFYVEEDRGQGEAVALVPATGLRFDELWSSALELGKARVREGGDARRLAQDGAWTRLTRPGLYNRLLVLPAASSPFYLGTMAELRMIAGRPDEDLRETALASFFAPLLAGEGHRLSGVAAGEANLPEFQPLNSEQRDVVASALTLPIVAVQGPPGTGKSLTVTHVLTAQALASRSALFASRNHRALEAVVPRLQAIDPDHPLIYRLTRNADDPGGSGEDWIQGILQLEAQPVKEGAVENYDRAQRHLRETLELRDVIERELREEGRRAAELAVANDDIGRAEALVESSWLSGCEAAIEGDATWPQKALSLAGRHESARSWVATRFASWRLARALRRIGKHESLRSSEVPKDPIEQRALLRTLGRWGVALEDRVRLETEVLAGDARLGLVERLESADEQVREATQAALETFARSMRARLGAGSRTEVAHLRGEIGRRNISSKLHGLKPELQASIARVFREALKAVPLWACSNLSVRSRLPLLPGVFDLVVIDEASQCDIPSCIPLLYRARRALVVGDPQQLQHVAKVGRDAEDRIRDAHGLSGMEFGAYLHSTNSVWNPVAAVAREAGGETFMLREHWRCHPAIARYVSEHFYSGELRVRTQIEASPPVLRGGRKLRGIEWTHVAGGSETTPGGSRFWQPQIDAIVEELQRIDESGFDGTVGVVTSFRAHADRIRDETARRLPADRLKSWQFASQTADGFQGDERDLILFGLVGGPDPADVPGFYARDRNRFNVAVSRARGLLHVFGDRGWAASCGLETLTGLHLAWRRWQEQASRPIRTDLIGPVWEPRFADALRAADIGFHQQYSACGFYLDFAILRPDLKLAVEVDGETYHRDPEGNLRIEDVRRDHMLRAAGWRVERFWVYQLRESLQGCIEDVQSILSQS